MKYEWNSDKNELLKRERGLSFEKIIYHLSQGDLWKTADHPNQKKYPRQRIYFVVVEGYVCLVPHVVEKEYIFLKTIIPSRSATKDYRSQMQ
ncbi:MAG: toxin [Spartobacteria bacterium]|nr:toxin [Spartobacteria bacterium]